MYTKAKSSRVNKKAVDTSVSHGLQINLYDIISNIHENKLAQLLIYRTVNHKVLELF